MAHEHPWEYCEVGFVEILGEVVETGVGLFGVGRQHSEVDGFGLAGVDVGVALPVGSHLGEGGRQGTQEGDEDKQHYY